MKRKAPALIGEIVPRVIPVADGDMTRSKAKYYANLLRGYGCCVGVVGTVHGDRPAWELRVEMPYRLGHLYDVVDVESAKSIVRSVRYAA